jgi:hypothetical protein
VRDEDAVARFVEKFALVMTESGMPRMPSRVFALLIATDSGKRTAAQLAEQLNVSPAAISGAVRYLDQVAMVRRARDPGERRDHYEIADNMLYEIFGNRDRVLAMWSDILAEGVTAVGPDTPTGHRLEESRRFFDYLRKEIPILMEKWRAQEGRA